MQLVRFVKCMEKMLLVTERLRNGSLNLEVVISTLMTHPIPADRVTLTSHLNELRPENHLSAPHLNGEGSKDENVGTTCVNRKSKTSAIHNFGRFTFTAQGHSWTQIKVLTSHCHW